MKVQAMYVQVVCVSEWWMALLSIHLSCRVS